MKDTLRKLRTLVNMKTALINSLVKDLDDLLEKYEYERFIRMEFERKCDVLERHVHELEWELKSTPQEKIREEQWWQQQNEDDEWINEVSTQDDIPF